jgi:iron complex outermembrane recepter protein
MGIDTSRSNIRQRSLLLRSRNGCPGHVRRALDVAVLSALAATGVAHAQDITPQSAQAELDEVLITGSRIQRSGMTTPTPVTSLTAEELSYMAPTTLIDALDQLPQFIGNTTPATVNTWTGNAGASILNMRGIGSNRTLMLLHGRRIVPSTRLGTTDVNLFPEAIIRRVESVTGGASAAYGSDAVAGVVNFILDTDYEGFQVNLQGGQTSRSQGENWKLSAAGGLPLGERSHLVVAGDYYEHDGIRNLDKYDWYQDWGMVTNPAWSASDPPGTNPQRIYVPNLRSRNTTEGGLITSGALAGTHFLQDGTPAPFESGDLVGAGWQSGGSGDDMAHYYWPMTANERGSLFAHWKYDVADNLEFFVQGLYARGRVERDKGPNMMHGPWIARVFVDNPYLDEGLRQQMIDAGQTFFSFARSGARDVGGSMHFMENQTYSFTTGVQGEVASWRLNTYYQYGWNDQDVELRDTVRIDRIYRSMDAVRHPDTNEIVCRSTLSVPDDGCVPGNFFGDGSVSAAAKAYIQGTEDLRPGGGPLALIQKVDQHFAEVALDRDFVEGRRAGPISLAVGASYRRDTFDQRGSIQPTVDTGGPACFRYAEEVAPPGQTPLYNWVPPAYRGCVGRFERASANNVDGSFDVKEVFTETLVPLVRGARGAQSLDLSLAWRYADYEGSGGVHAWKGGLDWSLTQDLRLRGTVSRDIRAGTLSERFDTSVAGTNVTDRWLAGEPTYAATQIQGGNQTVNPEEADTRVIGAVYQPSAVPGLGVSVDFFDVKVDGAISTLGVQRTIDGCFEDNIQTLCNRITRGVPEPGEELGPISLIVNTFLNVDQARTRGVDIETSYRRSVGNGSLSVRGLMSRIREASTTIDGVLNEQAGQITRPQWRGNVSSTYSVGSWSVYVQQNYTSSTVRNLDWVSGVDIHDNGVDSYMTTNLRLGYRLAAASGDWQVFLNVRNLFDKTPPLAPGAFGDFFGSSFTNAGTFDTIGRQYVAGVRFGF